MALPAVHEMLIGGTWVDVTARVRAAASEVTVTSGSSDWLGRPNPARAVSVLANSDGLFSDSNPMSAYYGLLGRNTQVRHRYRWVRATFTGATASSWPVADTGQAWTNTGGVASDYAGTGTKGTHTHPNVSIDHVSAVTLPVQVPDVTVRVNVGQVSTGDHVYGGVALGVDNNNCYNARLIFRTDSNVQLQVIKRVAGVQTTLFAATTIGTYVVGTQYDIRLQIRPGGFIRAAAWLSSTNPTSTTWNVVLTDTALTSFPAGILRSVRGAANTNANAVVAFDDFEVNEWRFTGEASSFTPQGDLSGKNVVTPVDAAGILRRLGAGSRPLNSAMFRTMIGIGGDYVPLQYWPLEDGQTATQAASGLPGGPAMTLTGSATFADDNGVAGSEPLLTLAAGASLSTTIPAHAATNGFASQFLLKVPVEPASETVFAQFTTTGSARTIKMGITPGAPARYFVRTYDASSALIAEYWADLSGSSDYTPTETDFFGHWAMWSVGVNDDFGSPEAFIGIGIGTAGPGGYGGAGAGASLGAVTAVRLFGGANGASFGHLAIFVDASYNFLTDAETTWLAFLGHAGEKAADRLARLFREKGIYFELIGNAADTSAMGPQKQSKFLDLVWDCVDADQGAFYEPRDALGGGYRTRASLYNQTPALQLSHTAGQLAEPFQPATDQQGLINYAIARREGGSFAISSVDSGPNNRNEPGSVAGAVGEYEEDKTWNLATDAQLAPFAGWRTHLGTWPGYRYPSVTVDRSAPALKSNPALLGQVAMLDVGSVLEIDDLPTWLTPDAVPLIVRGTSEVMGNKSRGKITFNTSPAGPYTVAVLGVSKLDTTSVLAAPWNGTAGTFTVTSGPLWTTVGAEWAGGVDLNIAGQRVRVNACAGAGNPQTFTVLTASVNGVSKPHLAGEPVHLWQPAYLAM